MVDVVQAVKDIVFDVVIAAGGAAGATFLVLKFAGEKWLAAKFERNAQRLQHVHERQIEEFRQNLNQMADRSSRFRSQQFVIIPELWSMTWSAHIAVSLIMPGFRQSLDLERVSEKAANEYLEGLGFSDDQRERVRVARTSDKNRVFAEIRAHHERVGAKVKIQAANDFLHKNALFLTKELFEEFDTFLEKAWAAVVIQEMVRELAAEHASLEGLDRDDEAYRVSSGEWTGKLRESARMALSDTGNDA